MNNELLKKTIKRLEDELMINRDVMDADDVEDLMDNIAQLQKYICSDKPVLYKISAKLIEYHESCTEATSQREAEEIARCLYNNDELELKYSILEFNAEIIHTDE